jgi:5' nucleotidase, deoxy (Pyrimidine), cytosolic type C protein (NT5C)
VSKLIVLDADGVLLDYNKAYPIAWKKAFGKDLVDVKPNAFYAYNRYDCKFTSFEQKLQFLEAYNTDEFWSNMELLPNVLEACNKLVNDGNTLVCVTKMSERFKQARINNFVRHGLPINDTYCVQDKYETLLKLQPIAFVDDHTENFEDLIYDMCNIHLALIDNNQPDSPNHKIMCDSIHTNLPEFVDWWRVRMDKMT